MSIPGASPKWRRQILPGRWMRSGSINYRMIDEDARGFDASMPATAHGYRRPFRSNPEKKDEEETNLEEGEGATEVFLPHRIVAMEVGRLKILSDVEAIMKMELSGDSVMVFRSESNRQLKVIYRRQDGNYGIIAPEA